MKIKKVARYKKEKKELDPLMELLKEYRKNNAPYVKKMHEVIDIDDLYLERLERNFKNCGGLKYYDSYEDYINKTVVPYLVQQEINIGDLR